MSTDGSTKSASPRRLAMGVMAVLAMLVTLVGGVAARTAPAEAASCSVREYYSSSTGWYNLGNVSGSHYELWRVPGSLQKKSSSPYGLRNEEKETHYRRVLQCGTSSYDIGKVKKVDFRARQCIAIYVSGGGARIPVGVNCGNTPWVNFPEVVDYYY